MDQRTTPANIRATIDRHARRYWAEVGPGQPPSAVYVAALDEATGGYWSVTYEEKRKWIDWRLIPPTLILGIFTLGIALLLLVPMLFLNPESATVATLSVPTDRETVVRTGQANGIDEMARTEALAAAVRTLAGVS